MRQSRPIYNLLGSFLWKWNNYLILYNFESLWVLKFWWFARNNLSYFSGSNIQAQHSPHCVLWNSALPNAVSLRGLVLWSLCSRHSGVSWFTWACKTVLRCLGTKDTWVSFFKLSILQIYLRKKKNSIELIYSSLKYQA